MGSKKPNKNDKGASALEEAMKEAAEAVDSPPKDVPDEIEYEIVFEDLGPDPGSSEKATAAIQTALNVFAESVPTDELPALTVEGTEIDVEQIATSQQKKAPVIHLDDDMLDRIINDLDKPSEPDESTSEHVFHAESLKVELDRTRTRLETITADFARFRKRTENQQASIRNNIVADVVSKLLPVMDNLDRAVINEELSLEKKMELFRQGLAMVRLQFSQVITQLGVTEVTTENAIFNPIHHDAMELVLDSGSEEGAILDCIQKGYALPNRLIRPAKVRVATKLRGTPKPATEEHVSDQLKKLQVEENNKIDGQANSDPGDPPEVPQKEEVEAEPAPQEQGDTETEE